MQSRGGSSDDRATRRAATITQSITALTALGALVFTGLSLSATGQQNEIAAQGQYTDRYTKAVEQVGQQGADRLQVRLGGIYALERLSRDSPRDQPTIIEVLSAFIRANSPEPPGNGTCPEALALDTQAALSVLARRDTTHDNDADVNLTHTCLVNADLTGARLAGANLVGANLHDAVLSRADLAGANLYSANLAGATLNRANLAGADLSSSNLSNAEVADASLTGTNLSRADLSRANLSRANLADADLSNAQHDAKTIVTGTATNTHTTGEWW
jgi:uncharacterized protein YjbI with pentapeptide repeats